MLTDDDLDPFAVGSRWKCQADLILCCHDKPGPKAVTAQAFKVFRIIEDGAYRGRFIRDDKAYYEVP